MHRLTLGLAALICLPVSSLHGQILRPPAVRELRVQKVDEAYYFQVRFETPRGLIQPEERDLPGQWSFLAGEEADLTPRLIVQDQPGSAVYLRSFAQRLEMTRPPGLADAPPLPTDGLEFLGKTRARGVVNATLLYPRRTALGQRLSGTRLGAASRVIWSQHSIQLDFTKAKMVAIPPEAKTRQQAKQLGEGPSIPAPVTDDLQGQWAEAQFTHLARLHTQADEFGFYAFAGEATRRKYHLPRRQGVFLTAPARTTFFPLMGSRDIDNLALYDTTTGAAAIAETLGIRRLLSAAGRAEGPRVVPVKSIQGIDIAEHPWKEMMGDKKPVDEPLARLIPHDNYYVAFRDLGKMLEFRELLQQWGGHLAGSLEVHSREYRLAERYEQQLCLGSTALAKTLGPLVLRGIALTGNDIYLREGSDLAVIFWVKDRSLFLAAVQGFLQKAQKQFGMQLKQNKSVYHQVEIESFVTPLREVSLHRASVGEFVFYANSLQGLHRILDAQHKRSPSLAEMLDFQYMRTVYRADDASEDGFAFLSDAFLRQLVGPVSKIKEKRRLEALTSLTMLSHAGLFHAWETGQVPAKLEDILASSRLQGREVALPEGPPATWDATRQVFRSEVYNTLQFATPLIELPIDKVTEEEQQDYTGFRLQYLGLWRRYFDPIGLRLKLTDRQVQLDTYLLPLVENSQYNELRRVTGGGTAPLPVTSLTPSTLYHFFLHLSPQLNDRAEVFGLPRGGGELQLTSLLMAALDPVGRWALIRADDSPVYAELLKLLEQAERGANVDSTKVARLVFQLPVIVGFDVKNPLTLGATLATLRTSLLNVLPGALTWEALEKPQRGVPIVRMGATRVGIGQLLPGADKGDKPFLPAVYYALAEGAFFLTPSETLLRQQIDQMIDQKQNKDKARVVEVNSSLHLAPSAEFTGQLIRRLLESRVHRQAQQALPVWYALHRAGVLQADTKPAEANDMAYRWLGFVPVSPDRSAFRYNATLDEMSNERHGSRRRPEQKAALVENSPLDQLLQQLRTVRADLRFREDGIQTVLTFARQPAKK